jgi:DNA polymerase III alpha subunit
VTIVDFSGKGECIVFSDAFQKYGSILQAEAMVMVIGKGEASGEVLKVIANEVILMEHVRERFTKSINLVVNLDTADENTVTELRRVMEEHRGRCLCYITVTGGGKAKNTLYLTRRLAVNPSIEFIHAVKELLGPAAVRLQS